MLTTFHAKDRNEFIVGAEYWTFYMETTNKGNALRNVVKPFKTKLIERTSSPYEVCGFYLRFSVPEDLKVSKTMRHNLQVYMNGYGLAQCSFYLTEEEAIIAFDKRIDELAKYQKMSDRDTMLAKKYTKTAPEISSIEKSAKAWKNKLTSKQKSYLQWFIDNS
jgi:hypothetical protein